MAAKSKEIGLFLNGKYFKNLVKEILKIQNYRLEYEIRKFESGCYTLLHDAEKEKPGIDFVIDFSKNDEYIGGYTTYLTEYQELLTLNPKPNSLSFIERKKGLMKYTKYFTHQNRNSIVQVVGAIFKK